MSPQRVTFVLLEQKLRTLKRQGGTVFAMKTTGSFLSAILILFPAAWALPIAKNIVVIIADDLGHSDLGFRGSAVSTPELDALAKNGVILESYYVQRACSPTRAAIMTGRYNIRYGMQSGVLEPGQPFGLDLAEETLPEALRRTAPPSAAEANAARAVAHSREREQTPPGSCAHDSDFHANWDCHGAGLPGFAPATGANATGDPANCCALCAAAAGLGCRVWTVYQNACYLKSSACQPQPSNGAISGGDRSFAPTPVPTLPPMPPMPPTPPGSWANHAIGKW